MKEVFVAIVGGIGSNLTSIQAAFDRLHVSSKVTSDREEIRKATHVILPGVGEASHAMEFLRKKALVGAICELKQPVLGICLGLQLFCEFSEENDTRGLGIFPLKTQKLKGVRVIPHMGWNNMEKMVLARNSILEGLTEVHNFYFAHSFASEIHSSYTTGICNYGVSFSASLQKDNFYGVQFHPEKSGDSGMKVLKNFLNLNSIDKSVKKH